MTSYPEGNPIRLPLTESSEQWEIDAVEEMAAFEPSDPYDHERLANEPND